MVGFFNLFRLVKRIQCKVLNDPQFHMNPPAKYMTTNVSLLIVQWFETICHQSFVNLMINELFFAAIYCIPLDHTMNFNDSVILILIKLESSPLLFSAAPKTKAIVLEVP